MVATVEICRVEHSIRSTILINSSWTSLIVLHYLFNLLVLRYFATNSNLFSYQINITNRMRFVSLAVQFATVPTYINHSSGLLLQRYMMGKKP